MLQLKKKFPSVKQAFQGQGKETADTSNSLVMNLTIADAVQLAAHDRFRAMVITSLTTIAGLLPLLMETSTQAQLLIPIVDSLVFGLASATLFSIFLLPLLS